MNERAFPGTEDERTVEDVDRHIRQANARHADEVVRYCPECGTIGPLPDVRQACCPDSFGMSVRRWQAEKVERKLEELRTAIARPRALQEVELPSLASDAHWSERIKTLMAQAGLPDSHSIYSAMWQLVNELQHDSVEYARTAIAAAGGGVPQHDGRYALQLADLILSMDMTTEKGQRARELARKVQEEWHESPAELALREIAFALGVGGYNAPFVDAQQYKTKILEEFTALASSPQPEAAQEQRRVPDGVWEALQRMIEDGLLRGPNSQDDARTVARWRARFVAARDAPQPEAAMTEQERDILQGLREIMEGKGTEAAPAVAQVQCKYPMCGCVVDPRSMKGCAAPESPAVARVPQDEVAESIKVIRGIMEFIRLHAAAAAGFDPALAEKRVNARLDKIAAALAGAFPEQAETYKGWYCAQCQRGVDPREVTYYEQHEVCGRVITDDKPPLQAAAPEAPAQADPCPGCIRGGVCKKPECGRLMLPVDHPLRTGAPVQAAPSAGEVELDSARLDAMQRYRIAVVPEFEGPWDAEVYGEDGEPRARGTGNTPREAIDAALNQSREQGS